MRLSTQEQSANEQWFDERICSCPRYIYPADYNWDREFQNMLRPPHCAACGKWADRVQMCVRCSQAYYQFFWHPNMGWEASLGKYGWECFDCLESFGRTRGTPVRCKKTPPPLIVVSPYYVKKIRPPMPVEQQALADLINNA